MAGLLVEEGPQAGTAPRGQEGFCRAGRYGGPVTRTWNPDRGQPDGMTIVEESPAELFRDLLGDALANARVQASESTEFYLVNLLTTFVDARRLPEPAGASTTLVELLTGALECRRERRLTAFRELGDFALFISGFFSESLNRRAVDVDYYVATGGRAYGQASRLAENLLTREIFDDLSRHFVAFMDVIGDVGEKSQLAGKSDVLLLQFYDRYLRTGSERARRKLQEAGLIPIQGLDTRYRQ